ncbi:MAG: radical SAM protein [Gammaproteobacteria bacterium]|nr:radical SAM protein [Gammaproteobacteria bacterium]
MIKSNILLIEPGYRNKYPPLGLMKLASYHRDRGDSVKFYKDFGKPASILLQAWDRVYVTTLFSFEWKRIARAIDFAIQVAGNQPERVFVGGIAASLMHDEFVRETRWTGVRFIAGLLDGPPASALRLSSEDGYLGADDLVGESIETRVPDYTILEHTDYIYPVHDAYFGYASRGCIRKCHFCGVPKLEGAQREMPPLSNLVSGIAENHGVKKDLILMDNNVTASARYKEVIAEIRDLGFKPGATLERDGKQTKRRVDFNQGVDARILAKSPMYLKEMSTICISPLRIAFDHIGVRKVYETSVRMAADNGITSLSNYMLYNFKDTPVDLYTRMKLNIALNEEIGVRIWSFPMRYQPVTLKDRSHVGEHWNRYYLRTFQIMLQATHGVVSGSAAFFNRAYGEDKDAFMRLLSYPHGFIFHRTYYENDRDYGVGPSSSIRDEYETLRRKMTKGQEAELLEHLATPIGGEKTRREYYNRIANTRGVDALVREVISFHTLDTKTKVDKVPDSKILPIFSSLNTDPILPNEEEIVEDSGLYDQEGDAGECQEPEGIASVAKSA